MTALIKFFEAPQDVKGASKDAEEDADLYAIDIEETGYQAQFSQLTTASGAKTDPTATILDPKQFLVEGLVRFNQQYPGRVCLFLLLASLLCHCHLHFEGNSTDLTCFVSFLLQTNGPIVPAWSDAAPARNSAPPVSLLGQCRCFSLICF